MRQRLTLFLIFMVLAVLPAHADFSTDALITRFAGTGTGSYTGDGGPAVSATLNVPQQITTDAAGNLYITDRNNAVIRMIDTNGVITTVAGGGTSTDNNIPATDAQLVSPAGVVVDAAGNIFIGDSADQTEVPEIRMGG